VFSRIPLRLLLVVPSVLQVSVAVGLTGWSSLPQGQRAVNEVARQLRSKVFHHIQREIETLTVTSHLVSQLNYDALGLGQLDPTDSAALFRHFMRQSRTFPHVDSLGRQPGFRAIAEGIETPSRSAPSKRLDCDYGQGYWFGKSQTAAAIEQSSAQYRSYPVS
jgi:hypothetical protein